MSIGTGRVALVTGASAGIGEAAARALLGAGFTVYGTSRRAAAGETRGGVVFLPLDVTDDVSVAGAVREVLERSGRIDVLVNNAGIGSSGASEDELRRPGPDRLRRQRLRPHPHDQGRPAPHARAEERTRHQTCRRSADSRPSPSWPAMSQSRARGRGLLRVRGPRGSRARRPDSARRALQHEHRLRGARAAGSRNGMTNAVPTRLAVATRPRATRPPETEARNIVARPVDSAIVDARAPGAPKCSVVTNVTAAGRGSGLFSTALPARRVARQPSSLAVAPTISPPLGIAAADLQSGGGAPHGSSVHRGRRPARVSTA